jgi:hypothetical protein
MNTNPVIGFLRTIILCLTGNIEFIKSSIDKEFTMEDGIRFKVFRHVIIRSDNSNRNHPQAVFRIRFQPKGMTAQQNKNFSKLPMLIFMGFQGFRSKYWMVNEETGVCQGVYEWDTLQDAERYSESIALRFMTKRSVEGSVSYEIIDKTDNQPNHTE